MLRGKNVTASSRACAARRFNQPRHALGGMLATALCSLALLLDPQQRVATPLPRAAARHSHPLALAAKVKTGSKGAAAPKASGGFGKKAPETAAASSPTPAKLLEDSMTLYVENQKDKSYVSAGNDEEVNADGSSASSTASIYSVTEYVVTVRLADDVSEAADSFSDWVPIAMLNLKYSNSADTRQLLPQAIGASVKEILEAGCQSIGLLRKAPRTSVEYAYEPADAYNTHVFEGLFSRSNVKAEALKELGIEAGSSPTAKEVKMAHRKLMMELHPDRMIGNEEGAAVANERMLRVQKAYESLGGGTGSASTSRYASIGGKARVDFSGTVAKELLAPLGKRRIAQDLPLELSGWRAGIYPLEPSVCQEFILRNVMAAPKAS